MANTPRIRFKGFTDDWEQRKLGEMCSIITKQTGFDYSATIKPSLVTTREPDTYSFIQNKDFEGLNINLDTDFYIPVSVAQKYPKIILDRPSLLISISGRIGNIALYTIEEKAFIGGAVGICKLKDVDAGKTAMYELMSLEGQKYFASLIKASSHANITVEDIRNIEVLIPRDKMEIIKLNEFIDNLSKLITLHQRKCDETKKLKKFMLQKMFPKNGEKNPEIRFAGFTDDWEQRTLGELVTIERGGSPRPIDKFITKDENGLNWIKIGDAPEQGNYITQTAEKIKPEGISKTREVQPGDLILSNSMSFGRPYIMAINGCIHDGWLAIRDTEKRFELKFLCILLGTDAMLNQYKAMAAGSTVNNLNKELVGGTTILYPNIYEQEKIGQYFSTLDHLITLHQRKCDNLKLIKKFMLQNMFPKKG